MEEKITPILNNAFLLLVAKDRIRKTRFTYHLVQKIKEEQNLSEVDIKNIEFSNVSDLAYELNSQSLFSKFKVLNVELKKFITAEESVKLCETVKNIPLKSFLILNVEKIKDSKITKLAKNKKCFVEFKELDPKNLVSWIKQECKNKGIKKYPQALPEMLKNICEYEIDNYKTEVNLDQVANSINLLSIYCDGNDLSLEELKTFYPEALAPNEFKLIDAIVSGDSYKTEQILSELFYVGKIPILVLSALTNNFKKLLTIKTMQVKGENNKNIMKILNTRSDYYYNKLCNQIRNLSTTKLKQILAHLLKADSRLKDKSLNNELVLSQVCGDLCRIYQK